MKQFPPLKVISAFLCRSIFLPALAALLGMFAPSAVVPVNAQIRAVSIASRQAEGRVVFCVTKDAILVAAVDGGAVSANRTSGSAAPRPPAIVPLGDGRMAVIMGAVEWTRDETAKPTLLDQELPAVLRKAFPSKAAAGKIDPRNPSADDIETIGVTLLEYVRPFIADIHYKLDLAADEPLIDVLLAAYTNGYGPEIWEMRYRVQQRNLGSDYWDTRPMRPSYYQLYPPEKGQPRTFIEARYPAKLVPLNLASAAQSDPAVSRIRSSSPELEQAVSSILKGESHKAATRAAEDFLRLAIPAAAGAERKLTFAALDQFLHFQWVLAPDDAPPLPAETSAQPNQPAGRTVQTDRPSLGRAAPPESK
jgi:hypothetical protein